jgi:cell wall assembly regulator SMI1
MSNSTHVDRLEHAWQRIMAWCEQHTPDSVPMLLPPEGQQAIDAAERATGVAWPLELKHWYSLHGGVTWEKFDGPFLLGFMPASLKSLLERHDMFVNAWIDKPARDGRSHTQLMAEPAGTPAGVYLPCYLPVGLSLGDRCLVLDTRGGSLAGPILAFDKTAADRGDTLRWSSLVDLLEDIAEALEHGRPSRSKQVRQRVLRWGFA